MCFLTTFENAIITEWWVERCCKEDVGQCQPWAGYNENSFKKCKCYRYISPT